MSAQPTLQIPADFEDMLKALCVASRIQRPLALHDEVLKQALLAKGFIAPSSTGHWGTVLLEDTMKVPGAAQVIVLLLQSHPIPVLKPSFAPVDLPALEPVRTVEAPAHAEPPPPPSVISKRRIELSAAEQEILRHSQVLGVAVDSLQRELDQMLAVLRPHFEEIEDPAQMIELTRTLPPGSLRRHLEEKATK